MQLLLTVAVVHLLACLSPGPDIFLVVLNSLRQGWRIGVATTFGILSGVSVQISLGIAGVTYLLTRNPTWQAGIAMAGGAWLIYLGLRGIIPNKKGSDKGDEPPLQDSLLSAWTQGLLANVLNPKAFLYFLSLFSVLLGPHVSLEMKIASGTTMLVVQGLAFSTVAFLLDRPQFKDQWSRLQTWLDRIISLILIGLGTWIWIITITSLMG